MTHAKVATRFAVWVVRLWQEQASVREEPLEWMRHASVPTTTLEEAWERVDWWMEEKNGSFSMSW